MTSHIFGDCPESDRYEIQKLLGKKAGRRTFLVRDVVKQELVIIKLLSFHDDFVWDDLKLFEREAETLKSLSHPAIPRYLDYFEVNSSQYKGFALVQTYIPAITLAEHLQQGRSFTESDVKDIAQQILEILVYLHGQSPPVIHRDIKPSNILLGDRSGNRVGKVYLVDFGSVQTVAAQEGATMTVVGTYGYMPPEQFGGRTVPASDLYSLGATLIYLVTGVQPADLPQKDLKIQFSQVVNITPALQMWLQKMTEPSLEKRFAEGSQAIVGLNNLHTIVPTPETIGKPRNSLVELQKQDDYLEICVPALGWHPAIIFIGFFAIAWNSFLVYVTWDLFKVPFLINYLAMLILIPFWGVGLYLIYVFFFALWGKKRLHLNRQKIIYTHELFGWKYHPVPISDTQDISQVITEPRSYTIDSEGDKVEVPPRLTIWAGVRKYELGGRDGFVQSEPEITWLSKELRDWLGI
ncbi:serine/threonine protein kinase [Calothrix sp. 336/3]|uniref:serine/threonine protein kinase n=1 Tax=Calothrix sp. 336/3 TaxID=1337936 RepID=UPI0004E4333B|nr:serine/threonine-protein kinase [Calothrix sp. 336/3]AKG21906.1 serine/threonine protein kinase [Calothrix sp. 336/3]